MYGTLAGVYFPSNLVTFVYREDLKLNHVQILWVLMIIRAVAMSIVFVYVIPAMIRHSFFFAVKKIESRGGDMSAWGIFIISWTLMMWFTKVLHGLATIILVTVERLYPDRSSDFFVIYSFSMRTYTYVVDFLNMVTLLYLFYC
jgi:hypothetical protein